MKCEALKILYIVNGNGLSDKLGGSLRRTIEIAKKFKEKGIETYILTTMGGFKACKKFGMNANYYILPSHIWKNKEDTIFDRIISYLISTLFSFIFIPKLPKVDVVYTDSDYFCDIIPALLYKIKYKNTKWIAMIHHKISVKKNTPFSFVTTCLSSILQKLDWLIIKKFADNVFLLKTDMGKKIAKELNVPEKISFVLNGVDLNIIGSIKVKDKTYDACFLGGLRPNKGLYDIVPIWREVCKYKSDAKLIIIGHIDPVYKRYLEKEIKKYNLEKNIISIGFVKEDDKIKYMKRSRVFIFPSHEEGFGMAILEAMACELPVVAFDLPTYDDIFKKGLIKISNKDIIIFANIIIELLKNENKRIMLAKDAKKFVREYDWYKIAEREKRIIKMLVLKQ
jgi:glycosyltransferase involved in cell wall biosynthesis